MRECPECLTENEGTAEFHSRAEFDWECSECGAITFYNLEEDRGDMT